MIPRRPHGPETGESRAGDKNMIQANSKPRELKPVTVWRLLDEFDAYQN